MDVGVGCMRYFGIRSYLDNFYDRRGNGEHSDDLQQQYLIRSHRPKFSSRWWKLVLWIGSFLVLAGFFLLLIGFLLPRKKISVDDGSSDSHVITVDRQALSYNDHLDISHMLGICLVVAGGCLFTFSLLMPTFCHMWCASGDSNDETDPFKARMETSSSEQNFPIRSTIKSIQPTYHKNESRLTTDGIVPLSSP